MLSLVIGAIGCAGETVSTPIPKTISQAKIRIIENSTEKLIIAFDYFTNDGQQAHFSDADLIASITIFPTDNPMIIVLSSMHFNHPAFQMRAYIEQPQIHNSEDTITIPKGILNFQDLDRSKMTLAVTLIANIQGNFNRAMFEDIDISTVDLAL